METTIYRLFRKLPHLDLQLCTYESDEEAIRDADLFYELTGATYFVVAVVAGTETDTVYAVGTN